MSTVTHREQGSAVATVDALPAVAAPASTLTTATRIEAPLDNVWNALAFYEEVREPPPLLLRLLLPVPVRVEGKLLKPGAEARCIYRGGHLVKRITRIDPPRLYEFEIAEQALRVGFGTRLLGGRYVLRELPDGATELAAETRYRGVHQPRWAWAPVEAAVGHAFHRFILRSIGRRAVEGSDR